MAIGSGSAQFDRLRDAFAGDPALRQETEWAFRLAVETYNPSDRGLRFITGGIGEWIVTLAAYCAGIVTLPDGHNANGHDTVDLISQTRALWSVKTSYQAFTNSGAFTISNGQGGYGAGFVVPTIFLAPGLPGIVYADPELHVELASQLILGKGETKLRKAAVRVHADANPTCVVELKMPVNPGSALRDPALEAVRLMLDGPQFPRLSTMFKDVAAQADQGLIPQLHALVALRDSGDLTEEQYRGAVSALTGAVPTQGVSRLR